MHFFLDFGRYLVAILNFRSHINSYISILILLTTLATSIWSLYTYNCSSIRVTYSLKSLYCIWKIGGGHLGFFKFLKGAKVAWTGFWLTIPQTLIICNKTSRGRQIWVLSLASGLYLQQQRPAPSEGTRGDLDTPPPGHGGECPKDGRGAADWTKPC